MPKPRAQKIIKPIEAPVSGSKIIDTKKSAVKSKKSADVGLNKSSK